MSAREDNSFLYNLETTWSNCDQLSQRDFPQFNTSEIARAQIRRKLAAREFLGLFYEVIACPFGVGTDLFFPLMFSFFRGSSLRLKSDHIGVRAEVLHAVDFKIR